jgi:hypothetical protein
VGGREKPLKLAFKVYKLIVCWAAISTCDFAKENMA